jgi:cyclopropane-fatty-acyl-phospholipid synthase
MSTTTASAFALPHSAPAAARAVFHLLHNLHQGTLDVQLPDDTQWHLGRHHHPKLRGAIRLRDWDVCAAVLKAGDIGFAEGYIAGSWTTPDLAALLKLLIANRDAVEAMVYGTWWGSVLYRIQHLLNRNSRRGSRKNIQAHYDLGNTFYRLWLDETMNYSAAWFGDDSSGDLAAAQHAKVRRALGECALQPGARLLEIGCGWGALAECAAAEFGAHVTGVTLSSEQLAHATARLDRAGLASQADLRLQDYRDIADPPFDAIASIEMFEAVGREYWPSFFATLRNRLKSGGRACIQTITIRDDLFERYLRTSDFIQHYIFPGGLLPSPSAFRASAAAAGLKVVNEFEFGADYAETLARWRGRFLTHEAQVRELGFDTRFVRLWEFYLAYCEAAFAVGNTNVVQFTLQRD